jgi:hypothetical protein
MADTTTRLRGTATSRIPNGARIRGGPIYCHAVLRTVQTPLRIIATESKQHAALHLCRNPPVLITCDRFRVLCRSSTILRASTPKKYSRNDR